MADEHPDFKAVEVNKAFNVADIAVRHAEGFRRVYANNSAFTVTFFDMCITFGEITAEGTSASVEQRVAVTMSIEHAKAMALGILGQLADYEKGNGPIRKTPPLNTPQAQS